MNSYKFLELYETAQAVVFILALKKIAGEVERILIGFIDTRGMMITTVWHVPCEVISEQDHKEQCDLMHFTPIVVVFLP